MKKLFFALVAFALALAAVASTPAGSTITSKSQLEESKQIGIYIFGDSVTHYLRHLKLLDNDRAGRLVCAVPDYDEGFFRIGRAVPSSVRVGTKDYLIKDMALYFGDDEGAEVSEALTEMFGAPEEDNGVLYWYSPNFCFAARPEGSLLYLVVVNYINL